MVDNNDMLYRVARLARALRFCRQESVFCEDLTFWQFFILETVGRHGRLPLSRLHAILGVEKSTTTRMVAPLVARGLVVRRKRDGDGRAVALALTDEGRAVCGRIRDCAAGYFAALQERIPENRRRQVFEALDLFAQSLEETGPGCCSPMGGHIDDSDENSAGGAKDERRTDGTDPAHRGR